MYEKCKFKFDESKYDDIEYIREYLKKIYENIIKFEKRGKGIDDNILECALFLSNSDNKDLKNNLEKILEDEENNEEKHNERLISLYILCNKYRRKKDFRKFRKLIDKYEIEFRDDEIYKIQSAYFLISDVNDTECLQEALNRWDDIDDKYKKMPAFIQIYTETVALCLEHSIISDNDILQDAIYLIKIAIKVRDYPKFYATLARLELCRNEYKNAGKNVFIAIDKEDSKRDDYSIRINEYQTILTKIEISQYIKNAMCNINNLNTDIEKMRDEINLSKYDNLSFLGFFSAILSLIIGTIQISIASSLTERYQLLMALAGIIIISFGSLSLLTLRKGTIKTSLLITFLTTIFGIILIILSIFLIPRFV